jgi:REP element-mobilizing transposase RayT
MPYDPFKHHRRSIRLKDYDYAQAGAYFVTIVIRDPELSLGNIVDGEMRLNEFGAIVQSCWDDLPAHYPHVEMDAFVVMPNHVHGVVVINEPDERRGAVSAPGDDVVINPDGTTTANVGGETPPLPNAASYQPTLGQIVGYFKYQSTKRINELRGTQGTTIWQRNYFEHIIRNEKDLAHIRQYIDDNPANWVRDDENPAMRAK